MLIDNLYKVTKKDIKVAAKAMGDAFSDDPLWNRIFEGENDLETKMSACFEIPVRHCLKYGDVYAISPAIEGLAASTPGNKAEMGFLSVLLSGAFGAALRMGAKAGKLMQPVFDPLSKDREENMKGREFTYLFVVGVQRALQGKGYGGQLLRAEIERNDQQGAPIYLETETEENVALYEHFGFKTIKKITLPIINHPMWEMVREPGA